MNERGYLIDMQHFSVNDGDGIRTTLFLAGCNMRCQWCANPESFTTFDKILHIELSCVRCGRCAQVCPYGVGIDLNRPEERRKCKSCGRCVKACPTGSRKSAIMVKSVEEILKEVERYRLFYRHSGGGITFSGGEATGQFAFLQALSEALYDRGYDLAMESNGSFDYDKLKPVLDRLAMCFIDIKHMDLVQHKRYTGMGNERTLETIKRIGQSDLPLVVRVPVIESVNATEEDIRAIARFVKKHVKEPRMELLPYHAYGEVKYQALAMHQPSELFQTPSTSEMDRFTEVLREEGITVERFV